MIGINEDCVVISIGSIDYELMRENVNRITGDEIIREVKLVMRHDVIEDYGVNTTIDYSIYILISDSYLYETVTNIAVKGEVTIEIAVIHGALESGIKREITIELEENGGLAENQMPI